MQFRIGLLMRETMNRHRYRFHSLEEWKSAIMNLPYFFDLAQSIFGAIKTPYNKQKLMDDLLAFLSRDDIRKNISLYIDLDDKKLITAIVLLNDPSLAELENFFLGDKNPIVLKGLILNLEERLIAYKFKDDKGIQRYALNPVFESILAPFAFQKEILFSCENADVNISQDNTFVIDDRSLGALIAFILNEKDFFRGEEVRKKINTRAKKLFPGLYLETAAGVLISLGLFYVQGDYFLPVYRRIQRFAALSPTERRIYWAAGICSLLNEVTDGSSKNQNNNNKSFSNLNFTSLNFSKSRIHYLAAKFSKFYSFLDVDKKYPEITFLRILNILEKEESQSYWGMGEKTNPEFFFMALETAGFIGKSSKENFWHFFPVQTEEKAKPIIAFDSAFSIILYPGISFEEIIKLASFSNVKDDTLFNFEITKASAVRGFDLGLSADDIINILKDISQDRIDEGLEWTLKDWENQYGDISLFEGLVLTLSEERRYLAETKTLVSLISKTLAPGVYLLSADRPDVEAVLLKAGVEIIGRPNLDKPELKSRIKGTGSSSASSDGFLNIYPSLKDNLNTVLKGKEFLHNGNSGIQANSPDVSSNHTSIALKNQFNEHLSKLKKTKEEKDELQSRIDRRVILSENQLEKAVIKFRKLEARGLDFAGKTAITKHAIAEDAELEIHWPGPDGNRVVYGTPLSLDKKEGEGVLLLKESSEDTIQDSGDTLRIPLGKISFLRLIKQSIF